MRRAGVFVVALSLSMFALVPQRAPATASMGVAGNTTTTSLSDLPWVAVSNGLGPVERDRSVGGPNAGDGGPIKLDGRIYAKGLGTHPRAEITYALDRRYATFLVELGIDDLCGGAGSVDYEIYRDGSKDYAKRVTGVTPIQRVELDVATTDSLRLVVTDGGDGFNCDHADWADARLLSTTTPSSSSTTTTAPTTTTQPTTTTTTTPPTTAFPGGDPTIDARKHEQIVLHADQPWPTAGPDSRIGEAYAELLLADDDPSVADERQVRAETLLAELYDGGSSASYPDFGDPPSVDSWDGEFTSPVFFRMWVDHPELAAKVQPETASQMTAMITKFVDFACNLTPDELAFALGDPWHLRGTENHMMLRRTNCLLGTYYLDQEAGGHPEWREWRDHLTEWLQERARNGMHDEIASPHYGKYTVSAVYGLRDFPGDAELARLANEYLHLFWHDVAHDFNRRTGVPGAAGTRTYHVDPATETGDVSGHYRRPTTHWARQWLYLYRWHDVDPGRQTHPVILHAAGSRYEPLRISRDLATMTGKSFEYGSRRPTRIGATVGQSHFIRRDVSVNDDFMTGAVTYDPNPAYTYNRSGAEAVWYSAAVNGEGADERIVVSGIGAAKGAPGRFVDWHGINGTAYRDVIIAARDKRAENSLGMRVYLGTGGLCANLQPDNPNDASKWFFSRSGNAYVAIRIPDARLDQFKGTCNGIPNKTVSLRLDSGEDIWTPIVVQLARAATFGNNFESFKAAVRARRYTYANGVVTYTSLRNWTFEMSRQQSTGSLPKINGQVRKTSPAKAYESPYLSMTWPSPFATARGPGGSCVVLNFTSPAEPPPACSG